MHCVLPGTLSIGSKFYDTTLSLNVGAMKEIPSLDAYIMSDPIERAAV